MNKINELIQYYNENDSRKENALIKVNLKLINELIENIEDSQDRLYMDKIISTCMEIIDIQREMIHESDYSEMISAGFGPSYTGFISHPQQTTDNKSYDIDILRDRNPYMPPNGGFQDDAQIREAFANYLKYHVVKKCGTPKMFADTTVYDYCSRIKVLFEVIFREWQNGILEGKIQMFDEGVIPGKTFLNAYNNIRILDDYIEYKSLEFREIEVGERKPFTSEEMRNNPLNNLRNLCNTTAALAKFREFKEKTEQDNRRSI